MVDSPFDVEIEVGEVIDAEPFPEAEKPKTTKLWIDLGDAEIQSAGQLDHHYDATTSSVGRCGVRRISGRCGSRDSNPKR